MTFFALDFMAADGGYCSKVVDSDSGELAMFEAADAIRHDRRIYRPEVVPYGDVVKHFLRETRRSDMDFIDWLYTTDYVEASYRRIYDRRVDRDVCPDGYLRAIRVQRLNQRLQPVGQPFYPGRGRYRWDGMEGTSVTAPAGLRPSRSSTRNSHGRTTPTISV